MSELAFNINGEAFEVPANATGWRVRKMRAKGSPEVVYAREGQPLVLPISAEIDDLRSEVDTTGRYRLDLVDQNNKAIEGAPSGYVHVNVDTEVATNERPTLTPVSLGKPSDNVVIEAMRLNSEIAKSVIDRFPLMLEAAATLLRAADGAGLPARAPRELEASDEEDDDDHDDDEAAPSNSGMDFLNSLVAQIVPLVVTSMAGKKMPKLGAILDWRKAVPAAPQAATEATPESTTAETDTALPPLDPKMMVHFIAIQSALTPAEAAFARQLGAELAPAELRGWIEELSSMSVPDAVAKVRSIVSKSPKAGGAS